MTFETTDSVTLKIWDLSAIDHTLDTVVQDLSARANAPKHRDLQRPQHLYRQPEPQRPDLRGRYALSTTRHGRTTAGCFPPSSFHISPATRLRGPRP